jgi:hypothetical protein
LTDDDRLRGQIVALAAASLLFSRASSFSSAFTLSSTCATRRHVGGCALSAPVTRRAAPPAAARSASAFSPVTASMRRTPARRRFEGDLEQADVAGARHVGAAAQLARRADVEHAHFVAVLLAEQHHGAGLLRRRRCPSRALASRRWRGFRR